MVFELDQSQRQLRLVKDNVFLMEDMLKAHIKLLYQKDLEKVRLELVEKGKKFEEYQATLNSHMVADATKNMNEMESIIKKRIDKFKNSAVTDQ